MKPKLGYEIHQRFNQEENKGTKKTRKFHNYTRNLHNDIN
jgi:hypothetical protein